MENFWEFSAWGTYNLIAVLLLSLLLANILRKNIRVLNESLIPTSVLGGGILIVIAAIYRLITGDVMFDTKFFGGNGTANLELITYHTLALGFIASGLKTSDKKLTKSRMTEIFNTGLTTVNTYLIQAVVGMVITIIAAMILPDFFEAAGLLLPFGYGQGTGQAMNYGNIYETQFGFEGGKSFGLTVAALGFLSASIGGVIHLNIRKKHLRARGSKIGVGNLSAEQIQNENEIPMQDSVDKLTIQVALVAVAYMLAFFLMLLLGKLIPGMKSVIFGFNFLLGVLSATLLKALLNLLKRRGIAQKEYINNFLMTRVSNFFFDIMVVAGIAAIRLSMLEKYWGILLILGLTGAFVTYWYVRMCCKVLFKDYCEEQFLGMYGMLTGTASTGIILLREIDGEFKTPAADNMVYQNFPAIVFGFPIMLLATLAPVKPYLTLGALAGLFLVFNVLMFRSIIFKKK